MKEPYKASWVDKLTGRIDRLPIPYWLFYFLLFVIVSIIFHLLGWVSGAIPVRRFNIDALFTGWWLAYGLLLLHYLDRAAQRALATFHSAVDIDDDAYENIGFQFTNMPAVPVFWLGGSVIAIAVFLIIGYPEAIIVDLTAPLTIIDFFLSFTVGFLFFPILIYHTWRQLRLVGKTYKKVAHVNMFNLSPLYAFSGLTARTGVGWALIVTFNMLQNTLLQPGTRFLPRPAYWGLITVIQLTLVAATFILPLMGIHRRLEEEKESLLLETNKRIEATIALLHKRVDNQDVDNNLGLTSTLSGLETELKVIEGIPTWPWRPGTLRSVLSAIFLPILLFLIQQVLARWLLV